MALPTNTKGYYKFNESSGDAADSSGNSYTWTNTNYTYSAGKLNNGVNHLGAGKLLSRAATGDYDFGTGNFTIAFWFKASTNTDAIAFNNIPDSWNRTGRWGVRHGDGGAGRGMGFSNATGDYYSAVGSQYDGNWHHCVICREGTGANQCHIYIDNGAPTNFTSAHNYNAGDTFRSTNGVLAYINNFSLDNLLIIKGTAWSAADVAADYNSGSGLEYSATPTTLQLQIGDAWKALGGYPQINIGDSWKAVAGMQINIGDVWKTIF